MICFFSTSTASFRCLFFLHFLFLFLICFFYISNSDLESTELTYMHKFIIGSVDDIFTGFSMCNCINILMNAKDHDLSIDKIFLFPPRALAATNSKNQLTIWNLCDLCESLNMSLLNYYVFFFLFTFVHISHTVSYIFHMLE